MGRKSKKTKHQEAAKWLLVGLGIVAVVVAVTQLILPAVVGVSLTGIFAAVSNKLGPVGSAIGSAVGYVMEGLTAFSTFLISPLMSGSLLAIVGFSGFMALFLVVLGNIYTAGEVWQ